MTKIKVQNTFITSPRKDNYISDKEGQIIFCTSYSKVSLIVTM